MVRARSLGILWDKLRLLKTVMFLGSFGFYKMCLNLNIFNLKLKKIYMCFFQVLRDCLFFLEIFTTLLTMQCPKCLFHMYNQIDQVRFVTCVKKVSRYNSASKYIYKKKHQFFFWLHEEDFRISYIFYKIQNFQGDPWTSIIATCLLKLLRTGPFWSS